MNYERFGKPFMSISNLHKSIESLSVKKPRQHLHLNSTPFKYSHLIRQQYKFKF